MDELRYALRAAVVDAPPSRIDLDRLVEGTRRRIRLQYRVGMAAGALAVMAAGLVAPSALAPSGSGAGGSGPPGPQGSCPRITATTTYRPDRRSEPPVPEEPCGVVEGRLTNALLATLRTELPGWTYENFDDPSQPVAFLRQAPDTFPDGYLVKVTVRKGAEFELVVVQVAVHGPADSPTVRQVGVDTLGGSSQGIGGYETNDIRADGTEVTVLGSRALGVDRLIRISRTPGLTLFP
jgi:hypothetical protein